MEADVRWHRGQTLAAGQVAEFKVWAELARQSMGGLHVFLPMRDRGIDGVVHRLADGAYVAIQVKGRTALTPAGQVHVVVTATSLVDDDALMVVTLVDGDQLGQMVLVVDEATFRQLAAHDLVEGREYLTAAFEMHAEGSSRWAPYLVQRDRLAERLGVEALREEPEEQATDDPVVTDRGQEGFLGEMEVVRRLADAQSLNLFRPFPDLETVEVLARHVGTRRYMGIQVKTSGWSSVRGENRVYIRRSSFRPSASTFLCLLAWDRAGERFAAGCLLIPSLDVAGLARVEGAWLVLELEPAAVRHRRLDAYRAPLASLGPMVDSMLGSPVFQVRRP